MTHICTDKGDIIEPVALLVQLGSDARIYSWVCDSLNGNIPLHNRLFVLVMCTHSSVLPYSQPGIIKISKQV